MREKTRLRRWREALMLPGETDLLSSALTELSEYYGISREAALRRARSAVQASRECWNSKPRRTPAQVINFYDTCEDYVFEHVYWHATLSEAETLANVAVLEYAEANGVRRYLDLGGGVGANLILFARAGIEAVEADVSGAMLGFARWRLERRGLPVNLIDLKSETLPTESFDLMTVIDVLEHVPDPLSTLDSALPALRLGGKVAVALAFGFDTERPMHLVHSPRRFLSGVRSLGLKRENPPELGPFPFMRIYRRVERGRAAKLAVLACDHVLEGARGMRRLAATLVRGATGGTA